MKTNKHGLLICLTFQEQLALFIASSGLLEPRGSPYLMDRLTLFQPRGHIIPTTLLLAPPPFSKLPTALQLLLLFQPKKALREEQRQKQAWLVQLQGHPDADYFIQSYYVYKSHSGSTFYGTEIEIQACFGPVGSTEKKWSQ